MTYAPPHTRKADRAFYKGLKRPRPQVLTDRGFHALCFGLTLAGLGFSLLVSVIVK